MKIPDYPIDLWELDEEMSLPLSCDCEDGFSRYAPGPCPKCNGRRVVSVRLRTLRAWLREEDEE